MFKLNKKDLDMLFNTFNNYTTLYENNKTKDDKKSFADFVIFYDNKIKNKHDVTKGDFESLENGIYAVRDNLTKNTDLDYDGRNKVRDSLMSNMKNVLALKEHEESFYIGSRIGLYLFAKNKIQSRSFWDNVFHPFRYFKEKNMLKDLENSVNALATRNQVRNMSKYFKFTPAKKAFIDGINSDNMLYDEEYIRNFEIEQGAKELNKFYNGLGQEGLAKEVEIAKEELDNVNSNQIYDKNNILLDESKDFSPIEEDLDTHQNVLPEDFNKHIVNVKKDLERYKRDAIDYYGDDVDFNNVEEVKVIQERYDALLKHIDINNEERKYIDEFNDSEMGVNNLDKIGFVGKDELNISTIQNEEEKVVDEDGELLISALTKEEKKSEFIKLEETNKDLNKVKKVDDI